MCRRTIAFFALTTCACAPTQVSGSSSEATAPKPTATVIGTHDVARLLAPLDQHAMQRHAFAATYRVDLGGMQQTIRFAYLAPNRARYVVESGGVKLTTWVVDGMSTFLSEGTSPPQSGTIPTQPGADFQASCAAALDAAFPLESRERESSESASPPDSGRGPCFEFMVLPDPQDSDHGSFVAAASWREHRVSFLSWLGPDAAWDHAELGGDSILHLSRGSTRATISMSTGFIEEMAHGDRFRARLVDFRDDADEGDFVPPEPDRQDVESSVRIATMAEIGVVQSQRATIYQRILSSARLKDGDSQEVRQRIQDVFTAFYRQVFDRLPAGPDEAASKSADELVSWFRFYWSASVNDPKNRDQIERGCTARRDAIERQILDAAQATIDHGKLNLPERCAPELVARIEQIERETARAVFQSKVAEPFLRRLDERLKAIRDAK